MHHDVPMRHLPSTQPFEQHWSSLSHALPEVLHSGFSGSQTSFTQLLLQQSESAEQLPWSETHSLPAHVVPLQRRLQQSVGTEQDSPGPLHTVIDDSQRSVCGLQTREQQSPSAIQSSP
jgi:hypothetical protein